MTNFHTRYVAIVPAAGSGQRMGNNQAKQYLPLLGKPLLYHTLSVLCAQAEIERVYVVLSVSDSQWGQYDWAALKPKLAPLFCGGATRADSVLGGLRAISGDVAYEDWVLVHDAARPCIASWHIDRLIRELAHDEVGGLLAVPVDDTLKQVNSSGRAVASIGRAQLWRAQTPQLFRYIMLRRALEEASLREITDEASAIEQIGLHPRIVSGDSSNLKVTYSQDLLVAEWILRSREESS